jgi:hypothetical protein
VTDIDIGGTTPGVEHDQIVVLGDAALAGNLNPVQSAGFVGSPGQVFDVIVVSGGGTVSGDFASPIVSNPVGAGFTGVNLSTIYQLQLDAAFPVTLPPTNDVSFDAVPAIDEIIVLDQNLSALVNSLAIEAQEESLASALPKVQCR